jgi:hypothetical protein
MLSVIFATSFMLVVASRPFLSVIMLNDIFLNVVAPKIHPPDYGLVAQKQM